MKALLSASDRRGLEDLGWALNEAGYDLVSTGGTGRSLSDVGLPVTQVSDLTGFPEIMDGRVKTLHPKIHGGILARRDIPEHIDSMNVHGIDAIDVVVVNLYPFVQTVNRPDVTIDEALENIDIGGPTLLRAAAKNYPHVVVVVDPDDYEWIAQRLRGTDKSEKGKDVISVEERKKLAQKAFQHVALYDTSIAQYLRVGGAIHTEELTLGYEKLNDLRYGENPHQNASVFVDPMDSGGIVRGKRLHGIDMSYNNILDAEAAWMAVSDFHDQAVAVVKHMNPCGLAVHEHQPTAYRKAFEGDSMSAFGGIVGFNTKVKAETAEEMQGVLLDVIVAPEYDPEALDILKKRKSTRVIEVKPSQSNLDGIDFRTVSGGALVQITDSICEDPLAWEVVTKKSPSGQQLDDLHFAVKAMKNIKSNSIVLAKDQAMIGMGAGQPNRVTSVHLGLRVAGEKAHGCVMASDAFFPFPDGIEMAAKGGVVAISQPGGSVNDDKVISVANDLGIVIMFTGVRHFKH